MKKYHLFGLLCCLVLAFPTDLVGKESKDQKNKTCELISSHVAAKKANKKARGKVVGVKLVGKGLDAKYRVRILVDEKRIKNINVKACK